MTERVKVEADIINKACHTWGAAHDPDEYWLLVLRDFKRILGMSPYASLIDACWLDPDKVAIAYNLAGIHGVPYAKALMAQLTKEGET